MRLVSWRSAAVPSRSSHDMLETSEMFHPVAEFEAAAAADSRGPPLNQMRIRAGFGRRTDDENQLADFFSFWLLAHALGNGHLGN